MRSPFAGYAMRLHWKVFFPLIGLLWLIIGITITYFVFHEKQALKDSLENRLLNVNSTVIEAYEKGAELQHTVDFIKLFTGSTTLDPLRITVYGENGDMIADNAETTIHIFDKDGNMIPEFQSLWDNMSGTYVHDMDVEQERFMICSKTSPDGKIHSFAALPYNERVLEFFSIDQMVWVVVFVLGILSSVLVYLGSKTVCRNIYALRDFSEAISSNQMPTDVDSLGFSNDELGDVSRKLLMLYREKLHAEYEKIHHERLIGINIRHELNTPISIIKGYLDTILSDPDMSQELKQKFLVRAQQSTDRLVGLIRDVNMVMRLQENKATLDCEPINMHKIAVKLSEDINQGNAANGMRFDFYVPENCVVTGHQALLVNALLNLTYNAAKHSGGTRIYLRWLGTEKGKEVFSFADNGVGVEEQHIGRLFDMFYRVDTGRSRKSGGSGLGLPLVNRSITAMGGSIKAQNAATGGLEFIIALPTAR